jgi:hypothetical protein
MPALWKWCLAGGVVCGRFMVPPAASADEDGVRIEIAAPGGPPRVVEGRICVEASDGGILLEHPDGRLEIVPAASIVSRSNEAGATAPETPRDVGQRVLGELPAGFDLLVTKHYVVCFDTSRQYAQWAASLFERLHDGFTTFWTRAGFDVVPPARPLVVVIFSDRRRYEEHAARDLGAATDRIVGYYNMLSNRVTTFDLTGSDVLQAGGRAAGRPGLDVLARPEAAGLVATLVHEGTHQMAFNAGMHRRLAPVPLWVCEGVATYFETPDSSNPRGWRAIGLVNEPRKKQFLATARPGWLGDLLRGDSAFRQPEAATEAYAKAWALTAYLIHTKKKRFVEYLRVLAGKEPFDDDPPAVRIEEFTAAFGPPDAVMEQAVAAFVARPR